jgi:hypothetical protein
MVGQQEIELTEQQIEILLQIINRTTVVGEQVEIIAHLKQTLIQILRQKQQEQQQSPT